MAKKTIQIHHFSDKNVDIKFSARNAFLEVLFFAFRFLEDKLTPSKTEKVFKYI